MADNAERGLKTKADGETEEDSLREELLPDRLRARERESNGGEHGANTADEVEPLWVRVSIGNARSENRGLTLRPKESKSEPMKRPST